MLERGAAPRAQGRGRARDRRRRRGLAGEQAGLGASGARAARARHRRLAAATPSASARRSERGWPRLLAGAGAARPPQQDGARRRRLGGATRSTLEHDRYLGDHRVDGRPGAPVRGRDGADGRGRRSPARRDRRSRGLSAIRLLSGIALEHDRPASGPRRRVPQDDDEVDVTIGPAERGRPHYRARVQLGDLAGARDLPACTTRAPRPRRAPGAAGGADAVPAGASRTPTATCCSTVRCSRGSRRSTAWTSAARARCCARRSPAQCVAGADGLRVAARPGAARQRAAGPGAVGAAAVGGDAAAGRDRRLRRLGDAGQRRGRAPRAAASAPASNPPLCHADHWFFGADGRLLAMLQDVVGVGTQALNRLAGAKA